MRYKNYLIVSLLLLCVTTTLFAKTSITSYDQNDKAKIYDVYGKYLAKETEEGMPNVTDIIITGDSKAKLNLEMGSVEMENATIVALYHESEGNTSIYLISGRLNVLTNNLSDNQDAYMLDIYTPIAEFTATSHANMTIAADQEDFVKLHVGDVDVLNGLSGDKYHLHAPCLYNFTKEAKLGDSPCTQAKQESKTTVEEPKTTVDEKTTVTEPKEEVEPLNAPAFDEVEVTLVESIVEPTKEEVKPTEEKVTEKVVEKLNAPKFGKVTVEVQKEAKPTVEEKTTVTKKEVKILIPPVFTKVDVVVVKDKKVEQTKKPIITKTTVIVKEEVVEVKSNKPVVVETNNLNKPEIKEVTIKNQKPVMPNITNVKVTVIEDNKKKN